MGQAEVRHLTLNDYLKTHEITDFDISDIDLYKNRVKKRLIFLCGV
jgi:hypothetical protein